MAKTVGISVGKTNYVISHSHALRGNAYRYILTPNGIKEKASITREFVKRKIAEYEKLLEKD